MNYFKIFEWSSNWSDFIIITGSSGYKRWNITSIDGFITKNTPNSSITFFLRRHSVVVEGYLIKSCAGFYPKSWRIEGSSDGNEWHIIDERRNNNDLDDNFKCQAFIAKTRHLIPFQYIRITQISKNHHNCHILSFILFDIFGELIERE